MLEGRHVGRIPAEGLEASYGLGPDRKRAKVKDISLTGVYLFTSDSLPLGIKVSLALQRWTISGVPPPAVQMRARSVRQGGDGVGLTFVHEDMDSEAWMELVVKAVNLSAQKDPVRVLRIAKAVAFLRRISPAAEHESLQLILEELSYESGERALDVVLQANEFLAMRGARIRNDVSPQVILRILEYALRTSERWVRQYWAGLLAACSREGSDDAKNLSWVALLSRLTAVQIRILIAACTRAIQIKQPTGIAALRECTCTADQIRQITGTSDLGAIERDLDSLYFLGLLEQTIKSDPFEPIDRANLTPTQVALKLYAMCKGRNKPEESTFDGSPEVAFRSHESLTAPDCPQNQFTELDQTSATAGFSVRR